MTYTVNYGKTDGYWCPYGYKAKDCGSNEREDKAETLEDIVSEEIKLYTESFEKEQTRKIEH